MYLNLLWVAEGHDGDGNDVNEDEEDNVVDVVLHGGVGQTVGPKQDARRSIPNKNLDLFVKSEAVELEIRKRLEILPSIKHPIFAKKATVIKIQRAKEGHFCRKCEILSSLRQALIVYGKA